MPAIPDATAFCARFVEFTDRPVRLPTEAEWEYVARAGTVTEFHYGDEPAFDRMNCNQSREVRESSDVGSYPPNPRGLFDTHGNVMEWCEDWYDPAFYAGGGAVDPVCLAPGAEPDIAQRWVRGGSWQYNAAGCRSALRNYRRPDEVESCLGFRVVFSAT